jgi:hypothetical protein
MTTLFTAEMSSFLLPLSFLAGGIMEKKITINFPVQNTVKGFIEEKPNIK